MRTTRFSLLICASVALLAGCNKSGKLSVEKATAHADQLVKTIEQDVSEVRKGLPEGAKVMAPLYAKPAPPGDDLAAVRDTLQQARDKVQDLRVAKSTFFALADAGGVVLRNDQEQDQMAGKSLFGPFPELKQAAAGKYVETHGSMPEATELKGRPDGQWVAAQPIAVEGAVKGLYVTGWAWSAYAYRLENAVRGQAREEGKKEPLLYVYLVVEDSVYGAPVAPEVSAKQIAELKPLEKIGAGGPFTAELEITGRDFGLAVRAAPALGPKVAVAVLRSET
jgi:hypothetical protein